MSLKELTFFGEIDKIQIAITRLKEFEPPDGYYLAFSGGKDSQCIYELAKMANVKFDAHFNLTTVDPPEVIKFTRKYYPDVRLDKSGTSMYRIIPIKLMPPTRKVRYCCGILKEYGGDGRIVVTGIRWKESYKRSKRRLFETCFKNKMKHYLNPIIDWETEDVWEFIKQTSLPYCTLYDEGYKRIGCIMCPEQGEKGMLKDAKRYPKVKKMYLRAFDKMIQHRKDSNLETKWETPEEVMDWWIKKQKYKNPDQTLIFE